MSAFFRGQRVRLTTEGITCLGSFVHLNRKYIFDSVLRGTVTWVDEHVHVRLDGRKKPSGYSKRFWEGVESDEATA